MIYSDRMNHSARERLIDETVDEMVEKRQIWIAENVDKLTGRFNAKNIQRIPKSQKIGLLFRQRTLNLLEERRKHLLDRSMNELWKDELGQYLTEFDYVSALFKQIEKKLDAIALGDERVQRVIPQSVVVNPVPGVENSNLPVLLRFRRP